MKDFLYQVTMFVWYIHTDIDTVDSEIHSRHIDSLGDWLWVLASDGYLLLDEGYLTIRSSQSVWAQDLRKTQWQKAKIYREKLTEAIK